MPHPIARIQKKEASGTTTALAITPDTPFNEGNCLVMTVAVASGTSARVSSISATGITWVKAVESYNTGQGIGVEIWYALDVPLGGPTCTINLVSSLLVHAALIEYTGVVAVGALDKTAWSIDSAEGIGPPP